MKKVGPILLAANLVYLVSMGNFAIDLACGLLSASLGMYVLASSKTDFGPWSTVTIKNRDYYTYNILASVFPICVVFTSNLIVAVITIVTSLVCFSIFKFGGAVRKR